MSAATPTRRIFTATTAAWLATRAMPAAATPIYPTDTGIWTNSVLSDRDGTSFGLTELQRPLTLIKLWAGWCPACAYELPQLSTLAAALGSSVEVVLISHPQYWEADQAMARRRGLPFRLATFAPSNPVSLVDHALLQHGGVYAVPRTLVFRERDSSIVLKHEGAMDWASNPVMAQVKGLLG